MNAENIRILLVDDHQLMREGVRRLLNEQPGWQVVGEADRGVSALELARTLHPDVVVMDIHLPGQDGVGVSESILQELPGARIVVLSADTELATVKRALQSGVAAYLTKSGPSDELVQAIRAVWGQRVYLCNEVADVMLQDYMKVVVNPKPAKKPVLTERERLLLKLVAEGKRNKEIAEALQIGLMSAETYRSRLMHKLKCNCTAELIRYAIREGIAPA